MSNEITKIEYKDVRVLTTEQLAQAYGCQAQQISQNFKNNQEHFEEGMHFFKITGQELKDLRFENFELQISPKTRCLYLWTRRGASRHCKMLGTERAWDMYDSLEENYFNPQTRLVEIPSYQIQNEIERAKRWIEEQQEKQKISKELEVAKPLAEQTVRFVESGHLIGFRELAKELNIKETELNRILIEHGWKYKVGHRYKYRKSCITKGYMETKDSINEDTGWSGTCDKFTVKGRMEVERMIHEC